MDLRSLSSSATIPQQLQYLGIQLELLRQNIQDQNNLLERQPLLSGSRPRRNATAGLQKGSSAHTAEVSSPRSRFPPQRNTPRNFVGFQSQADDVIDVRRWNDSWSRLFSRNITGVSLYGQSSE
jgi:hypothetical protein